MPVKYPFYGKVFDILFKIPAKSWFGGSDSIAKKSNANGIVTIHQLVVITSANYWCKSWFGVGFHLSYPAFILLALVVYVGNVFFLFKRRESLGAMGKTEYIYMAIFFISAVLLAVAYFTFDANALRNIKWL